jgi:hypothetical protein
MDTSHTPHIISSREALFTIIKAVESQKRDKRARVDVQDIASWGLPSPFPSFGWYVGCSFCLMGVSLVYAGGLSLSVSGPSAPGHWAEKEHECEF